MSRAYNGFTIVKDGCNGACIVLAAFSSLTSRVNNHQHAFAHGFIILVRLSNEVEGLTDRLIESEEDNTRYCMHAHKIHYVLECMLLRGIVCFVSEGKH